MAVEDNGTGSQKSVDKIFDSGIGLKNLKERLKELYKDDFTMTIAPNPGEGFQVEMIIPLIK